MRATALAAALCISAVGFSATPNALAAIRKDTNIAEQDLGSALRVLERDRSIELIYLSEDVRELRSPGASGDLTSEEALRQLLEGTGLTFRVLDERTVTILPVSLPASSTAAEPQAAERSGFWRRFHLARANFAEDLTSAGGGNNVTNNAPELVELETVQVTGSRLGRANEEGAQPVLAFSRAQIQRSGQNSIAEFLRTLPEVSGASMVEAPNGSYPHVATIQLRGLPAGRTLMLINGRRLPVSASTDGSFANLNAIPEAAIERIDVLPQGASAIYGSDALAGVVNIITRKDVDMTTINAKSGFADGTSDRTFSAGWARSWERGSALVVGEYYDRTALFKDERDSTRNLDFTSRGWRDLRSTACNPGTVYSATSANLPGLNSTTAAIPEGLTGTPTIGDFASTAGTVNRCGSSNLNKGLIYPADRYSVLATGDFKVTENTTVFAELQFSRLHHEFYPVVYLSRALVPASNPYNPFGTAVRVDYLFDNSLLGNPASTVDEKVSRAVLGAHGDLAGDWQWETNAWGARDNSWTTFMIGNPSFVPAELSSTDPASALNLFTSGAPASQETLMRYMSSGLVTRIPRDAWNTTTGGNVVLRGSVFTLPAGAVSVAVGAEYGHEQYENTGQRGEFDVSRNNKAAFAEVRVPVLARASSEMLTLSAALRRDDYSDFGSATTPQFGIEWHPFESLLVRAAYAEAFRAPDLYAVYGPGQSGLISSSTRTDPRRNNEFINSYTYQAGGNADLKPETGRSVSAGVVWNPSDSGFRAALNWWKVSMSDRISLFPSEQLILNNESLFPDRVTRAAPSGDGLAGRVVGIDYSALNLGDIWVEGVDLDVSYRIETALGTWSPSLRATRYTRYDALLNPSVGMNDYLAKANTDIWVPKWRATTGVSWNLAAWSASLLGRYVGKYRDYNPLNDGTYLQLGNQVLWDLNASWDLGQDEKFRDGLLSKLRVAIGVVNLFDSAPQFSASTSPGYGFDAAQGDIRGRYIYGDVSIHF
jgi:iron complex outermembrane receptor protein